MAGKMTFREWLADQHYSPRSVTLYDQYARRAERWLRENHKTLRGAKPAELRNWWTTLPPSSSSRNGARHALIAWYRFRGHRDGGPARFIDRIPSPQTLPRPVTETDYLALLEVGGQMGGVWSPLVGLLTLTGCRVGEAAGARWSQFDFHEATWRIEGKGSRRRGPKVRVVPLHAELMVVLLRWRGESLSPDWVFPSDRSASGHLTTGTLQDRLTEACQEAGIPRATCHRWRHTVATLGLRRTGDLRGIQTLLGHASLATTQIYTQLDVTELRALVGSLGSPTLDVLPV